MATVEDLFAALRAADQAGNVEDATKIAKVLSGLGYGPKIEEAPAPPPEPGFFQRAKTAIGRGLEQVPESLSGISLGTQAGLGLSSAERKLQEIQAGQAKPTEGAPAITYEELEKTYGKDGALAVLQKLPTYVTEQILQSAPSMAIPLAVGAAATPFTGPIGGLVAGIGTYGAQQFGQFMQRQAAGAKTAEELEPGKAALAAGVTAPLGFFVDRLVLGMSKVPTKALGDNLAAELAKRAGASVAGRAASGATIGIIAEAPTEMLEQMAERWQANLPLFDDEAVREYKEAAAGGAAIGGVGGAASRVLAGRPQEVQQPAPEALVQPLQAPTPPEIPEITPAQVPPQVEQVPPQMEQVPPQVEQVPPAPAFGAPLGGEIRQMPGFAGPANANQQLMAIARQRQAQAEAQAAKDAAAYQRKVQAIEGQSFSSDPLADRLAKDRMIASLPQPQAPAVPAVQPTAQTAQPPAELNYFEQQDAIRRAEEADRIRGMKPRRERDTRLAPEELAQMGIPVEEKKAKPQFKATEHPENVGLTGFDDSGNPIIELLSAGAKPFKNRRAAEMAKAYRNDMKIVRLPTSEYVLSPKTDAELAREQQSAKKLGAFQSGQAKGLPEAAHEYIISKGGFAPSEKSKLGLDIPNIRIGNKFLFSQQGGMTVARAAEYLREAGYIETEEENAVINAMEKTFKLNQRIYTPEGYERIGEIEQDELNQQYQKKAEQEALYTPEADVYDYMASDDFYRQPMDEVRRLAEAHGVDAEAILDELGRRMPDATQDQYEDVARDSIAAAIRAQQGVEPRSIQSISKAQESEFKGYNATKEGLAIQKQIEGKSINQVADWLVANAPSAFQRLSAEKTRDMIRALQGQGVKMTFEVQGGDRRVRSLYDAKGYTGWLWTPNQSSVDVKLNGEPVVKDQLGYPSGMNYGTLLHELMHVATRSSTKFLPTENPLRKDLVSLFNKVVTQYNADFKAGKLPPVLEKFSRRMNNALLNPDELITWGFQDREFQQYLDNINVGPKQTAFNKLVSLIRDILGFAKPFETALERLVRTTDGILSMDVGVIGQFMEVNGYSFGNPKAAAMLTKQETLFSSQRMLRDTLESRAAGFYFDAKQSPLYQTRTAQEVGDFSQQEADKIVSLEGRAKKIQEERRWVGKLEDGAWVGTRLDLAVFRVAKKAGLPPVLAVHEGSESKHVRGGFSKGELLRLVPHITLRNVRFNVMQGERERIAEGGEKGRMASADGQYMDVPPNFDGIEVSFNPTREHLFRDALGRAVKYADEVTVLKNRMYARGNIEYFGAEDVPPVPTQPSDSWVMGSGQDARQLEQRPAIIDDAGKVSKEQQKNLFDGQDIIQDSLFSREAGFFIDAKQSPLYQTRSAADVPVITQELANRALATHAKGARVEGKGIDLKPGDYIGARLDLPIRASSRGIMEGGVPLQAIHMGNASNYAREDGGFYGGKIAKYLPSVTMKNVKFRINQTEREEIAAGRKKAPMGSADGQFVRSDNPNFDGIELRFNPKREHLFIDAMGRAVKAADEVTVMGDRMYARGHVEYFGDEDFIQPKGVSPTQARVMSVEEAVRQAGPAVERAVMESVNTGKPLAPPIQESLFEQFDQADVIGRGKITPVASEKLVTAGTEDPYLTSEEKIILYLSNYPNAKRKDIVAFDDVIYFKQPDGRYTDDPLGRPERTDMEFNNELEIRQNVKQYFDANLARFSLPPQRFAELKRKAKVVANAPDISDISMEREAVPTRTRTGADAMEILSGIGRFVEPPEPGYVDRVRESWRNARDNPQATREQAAGAFRRWTDQVQTWAFSSDAALNNQIRRSIMDSSLGNEEKIGTLLNASLSQTVHSDAIANLFLMEGNIKWDEELHKWAGVKDSNNIINLSGQLDKLADAHGLTKEEAELIAHTAFEARRTASLIRENQQIDAQVEAIRAEAARIRSRSPVGASELSDRAQRLQERKKIIHMTPEQIEAGMLQFQLFPELQEVADTWNGIRENALKVMVDTGLYSQQEAEDLLANADYVPFFREDQIEEGKGPKEFLRSLSVQADQRMRGSMKPVNDIFDNMVRWTQYAVNRGVRNRSALALVDTATGLDLADRARGAKDGDNVVRVWRNGQEEFYNMADPMFVSAFRGLESVAIPTVKYFSKIADWLRQSVVLYPGFAIAQVPQDAFAAMFTSGLKPQYALRIPVLAVKEFVQTLRGKSSLHEELKNVGVVGVRDFTSSVIRNDAEVLAGLKKDKSFWDGVKRGLGNWAMAADNSVRQATYQAAMQQGLSRAEAIEKSFEIFNVRRRGNSKILAMAGQVIPFFNAYLAAQNVAYKTLTGVGTSPTSREAALKTLAATTGSVFVLSLIYAMMNGDDEDYLKKPTPTRDRLLMIPGTGASIPLRADLFLLPKVIAEHTYMMMTDKGFSDPAKFRESIKSILANGLFSPTAVPQAIKPLSELILNYDFFQQKPLVGVFQQQKELGRQFEDSTSELSKLMGKTGYVSPIMADHFIRGMFGSVGGLALYMTNPVIAAMAGTTRPEVTMRDALATVPNASAFVTKEYDVGLRKDFYALKEVTDRVASTVADMKNRSPQEIREYLEDPKVKQRLAMSPGINQIAARLTDIRKQVNLITNLEDPRYTSADKEQVIKQLREKEYQLLKNIDLKKLREMAQM